MSNERYIRNHPAISEAQQKILGSKTAAVIGCGGLGGHIADALARIGIGGLVLIDPDVFSESNLNRQLLSLSDNIGKSKAREAEKRVKEINPDINTVVIEEKLTTENAQKFLGGCDIALDALDSIEGRFAAEDACEKLGIYFIHGAVAQWSYQASSVAPGSRFLEKIYPKESKQAAPSVLSFTVAAASAVQTAEAVKVLTSEGETLEGKLLIGNLLTNSVNVLEIG